MSVSKIARRVALLVGFCAPLVGAQGAVTGQVSLKEREGEKSEDLNDVIVWLEPVAGSRARSTATTATIQLQGRQFSPRVRVVAEGSKVEFPNQDSFSHNVFSKAADNAFDTGVYARGRARDQTFKESGVVPIYCNVHPRMTGYIIVLKTPYFAQAGDDGRFSVTGVPAGNYVLHVWHDRVAQETVQPVTVAAAGLPVGRVEMDARGFRYVQHKNKFGKEYASASGDRY